MAERKSNTSVRQEIENIYGDVNLWTEATGCLEFKRGEGGLPKNLWETYSSFGNTDGGIIVVGVENDGTVVGLANAEELRRDFVNLLSNGTKCSVVLCREGDIEIVELAGKQVLGIRVHEARLSEKPVFLDGKVGKCYIRRMEGDAQCDAAELERMLRDRDVLTKTYEADAKIIAGSGPEDLDPQTIMLYRGALRETRENHPWSVLSDEELLIKIGAYRTDRNTGERGLTLAGLLMFGRTETIKELHPLFKIDYFEYDGSEQVGVQSRWADRITADGTWEANLYRFFLRVLPRLTADLKRPFQLGKGERRRDDSVAHDAVREALANAIIHADYREPGGIRIDKSPSGLRMTNAGTLLMSKEEVFKGGLSLCRNRILQNMFKLVGIVEEAGSGIDILVKGWVEQFLSLPKLEEDKHVPQVVWELPYLAMAQREILNAQREYLGYERYARLSTHEKLLLLIVPWERFVSNRDLRIYLPMLHTTDVGRMLTHLRNEGYIQSEGHSNATRYRLSTNLAKVLRGIQPEFNSVSVPEKNTTQRPEKGNQRHLPPWENPGPDGAVQQVHPSMTMEEQLELPLDLRIKLENYRRGVRHNREITDKMVLDVCRNRNLTLTQLSVLLNRSTASLRKDCISSLLRHGKLRYTEESKTNKNQAYTTV